VLNRFVLIVIVVPLAIILIALAVANRAPATFTMDPFNPGNPALTLQLPLFVMLFLALAVGILIGSAATWLKQGRYRKLARQQKKEVQALLQETRTKPAQPTGSNLPAPTA
jgi:uncharacterized integral membrane protein